MKKSNLWTGIAFVAAAILCVLIALLFDTPLDSILCGFAGGLGAPGLVQIYKYFKWSRPENAAEYQERMEMKQIELRDERKEMLRNKAGRYAYIFNLLLTCAGILAAALLDRVGVIAAEAWLFWTMAG